MSTIFTIAVPDADGRDFETVKAEILKRLEGLDVQLWKGFRSEQADVSAFHRKFNLIRPVSPHFLPKHAFEFREKFQLEECVTEFRKAHDNADMHGVADSLADGVWVLHGTADMMGIPWYAIWDEVRRKNMLKQRAKSAGESKRGSTLDVIKPPGWTPPDHTKALGTGPWPTLDI